MLEIYDLTKIYSEGTEAETFALNGVSFKVPDGDYVAIIGPSGSGKSTLMNQIGALDRPTSGRVVIDGVNISELSSSQLAEIRNQKIGFVFQSFNLINRISAEENVEIPLLVTKMSSKDRRERAISMLEKMGLGNKVNKRPNQLSGGEQQRVAVARALANDPKIILGDEPTGNLDSKNTEKVMEILEQFHREAGKTLLLIT
ncbi:MAG TPA: ABC transporter ATP-binding protein, partial [Nitrososphaerales archaeon]|nr:ABC transporter ATP-binding protein [Nitrososphaerales archaeon]